MQQTSPPPLLSRRVLSQAQVDDFAADGYLRIGGLLDDRQVEFLRREYDAEIERAQQSGYIANLAAEDSDQESAPTELMQVYGVATLNLWFRKLAFLDAIVDVVEDLIGPNIRLLQAHLLSKPPRSGSAVLWHHDNVFHRCVPANMVTAWLTLDDTDRENGAMQMLPGSHLRPASHDEQPSDEAPAGVAERSVVIDLPAGGMLMHHCQLMHCSSPNRSDRPRRAVVLRYIPVGTESPRLDARQSPFFAHPIVRLRR